MGEAETVESSEAAPRVVVYSTDYCGYCERAKMLLSMRGIPFDEVKVPRGAAGREELAKLGDGVWTFPQITIDGVPIGGFRELVALDRSGRLQGLGS